MPTQVRIGWRSGSSSQTAASIVTSGLILNLDAGNVSSYSGTGTTLTDLSSTGNNGTLTNGTSYSSGYLTFDGVNDYVDMGNNTAYNLINLSVSTWVRPTVGGSDFSPFLSRYSSGIWNYQGWLIYYNKSTSKFFIDGRETSAQYLSLESNNTYPINNWYNVMWTKSGNTWSLYINGVLDRTLTLGIGDIAFQTNNMQIGALRAWADSYYGKQDVGTVNIYNRVLSASEITQNFDATKARFGYSTLDTDVQAFVTAASITDATQQSAVNTLVTSLKTAGIWTKLKAVYPFVGGNATSHKFNLKDPRDLDVAYRLVFSGGWVHSSTGAKPNGTTGYANTGLVPNTVLQTNSTHLSYYSRTDVLEPSTEIMAYTSGQSIIDLYVRFTDGNMLSRIYNSTFSSSSVPSSQGFFIMNRPDVNTAKQYRNSTLLSSSSLLASTKPTIPLLIGCGHNNGAIYGFSTKETAFASIGDGLTDAEATAFYTAVQTFQTSLGRHVGVPIVADTDAQAFLNAAEITSQTQASAVNTLVTSLKTAGVWTKMKALYPFVGGNATSHKFNLKDPRDLDAAYRLVFNGGWTHTSTGALPNGSNAYVDTRLNTKNVLTPNNLSIGLYTNTNRAIGAQSRIAYGNSDNLTTYTPLTQLYLRGPGDALISDLGNGNFGRVNVTNTTTAGFYVNTRTANNSMKVFKNNTLIGSSTITNPTNTLPNSYLYFGAFNNAGSYTDGYESVNYQFSYVSDGLTDAEATAFYNAVQAFQTTLGRQV